MTSNWNDRSLAELKAIVDEINPAMFAQLRSAATHFQSTTSTLNTAEADLLNHMSTLRDAWQGKAASAAIANVQQNAATMNQTSSASELAQADTDNYLSRLQSDHRAAQAVPDVDTSWGKAFSSGGWAGPIGVGVAKHEQQQKYDKAHTQMVKLVSQMDSDGSAHSAQMKGMDWPSGSARQGAPPATLPPVPGAAPGTGGGNPGGYPGGGANPIGGGGYTP
ncbi:MAG TPA: WXG100 family type VII secretion target, partial [Jatrophihabitantaceae bacterium]|nr:WXG100 family type VII secretion target [Jatrophihabitantaceae bacterium]